MSTKTRNDRRGAENHATDRESATTKRGNGRSNKNGVIFRSYGTVKVVTSPK